MQLPTVLPSERDTGIWTTCVWLVGLYIARAFNPAVPATKAEMLAIAAAGVDAKHPAGSPNGESGNFTRLAVAMKARYGLVAAGVYEDDAAARAAVLAAAQAGPVAVGVAGDQLNLTPHYQSNSLGHAIAVIYPGGGSSGTQFDPLAPSGYAGDPFPATELARFTSAAIIFKAATGTILKPVRQEWTTGVGDPGGVFFTGGPGLGARKRFNLARHVTSIAESTDGAWRLLLYGAEILWMARANLTPIADTRLPADGFGLDLDAGDAAALAQAQADLAAALERIATIKQKVADNDHDVADD